MVIEDDQVASIEDAPVASTEVSQVSPILDPWWSSHHHPTIVSGCLSVLSFAMCLPATSITITIEE